MGGCDEYLVFPDQAGLLISDFVGQLKGASAHEGERRGVSATTGSEAADAVHVALTRRRSPVLEWQAGYGVVSFGTRNLDWVVVRGTQWRRARSADGGVGGTPNGTTTAL